MNYAWEDLARAVPVRDLDFIVMNPPFHEGKKTDSDIGKQFIETASRSLRQGGQLWMVANAGLPYESVLGALFASHEKITEKNGFKVKEVFESMLDANASKISDYQGLIFVGYSPLWYQKKVFRQVVQGKLP